MNKILKHGIVELLIPKNDPEMTNMGNAHPIRGNKIIAKIGDMRIPILGYKLQGDPRDATYLTLHIGPGSFSVGNHNKDYDVTYPEVSDAPTDV